VSLFSYEFALSRYVKKYLKHSSYLSPGVYVRDYAKNGCKIVKQVGKENRNKDLISNGTVRTCNSFWRPQVRFVGEK
jgi:hypothetical protein